MSVRSLPLRVPVMAFALLSLPFAAGRAAVAGEEAAPATRTFSFEYKATIPAQEGAKRLDAWVPVPLEDDLQKVADLKVETKAGDAVIPHEITKDDLYGNRMVHVGLDAPKGPVTITWSAVITRSADVGQGTGPVLDRFKEADNLVPITGHAAELAKTVKADAADDRVAARAKRIYDHVLSTMVYDKVAPGYGKGDFERACVVGKGNCTDFHAKFTGIARAAGIPVRFTMGIPLSTDAKGAPGGYHCWAHFLDGKNWVPVDISEAQKVNEKDPARAQWFFGNLDPDRLSLTVGRDLNLVPQQKGPPLLFFVYPYVEVDGKSVELPATSRSFSFENR